MTVDELIKKLQRFKSRHGGYTEVVIFDVDVIPPSDWVVHCDEEGLVIAVSPILKTLSEYQDNIEKIKKGS